MSTDFTAWIYVMGLILFSYGSFLFVHEIIRKRGGSWIFYYLTILFVGGMITYSVDVYARYLRFEDMQTYYGFMDSFLWKVRRIPIVIIIGFIDVHVTIRIARRRYERETEV